MPIKKRTGKRRSDTAEPTVEEWAWLTAGPDHNQFIGFALGAPGKPTLARLGELWRGHEAAIRALWQDAPPAKLPHGHPARDDGSFEHALERERRQAARSP